MTDKAPTVPVTPNNELLLNLGLTKEGDNDTAITAAALYDDEKKNLMLLLLLLMMHQLFLLENL